MSAGLLPDTLEAAIFRNTDLVMAIGRDDFIIEKTNPAWDRFLDGQSCAVGSSLKDLLPRHVFDQLEAGAQRVQSSSRLQRRHGFDRWVDIDVKLGDGKVFVVLVDVGQSLASLLPGEEARRARDLLLHDAAIGTWFYDPDADIYHFSPELRGLTPLAVNSRTDRPVGSVPRAIMDTFYHPDDLLISRPMRERIVREGGAGELEIRVRNRSKTGWDHLRVLLRSGRRRPSGRFEMYGLTQTVTELVLARDDARSSAEQIRLMASTDALTALANRMTFEQRLQAVIAANRTTPSSFAIFYIDLDRFKEVNDTLGHQAGDELIREAAHRLSTFGAAGDTVARLGGDEFAILKVGIDARRAVCLAQRAVVALSDTVDLKAGRAILSGSVGVTVIRRGDLDQTEILRQADLALYQAKAQGRSRYCLYGSDLDAAHKTRKMLESDLSRAIANDEIQIVYQPIVRSNGEIVGVEALSRWPHPTQGMISPAQYIPLAEQTGLITPFGAVTFRRICRETAHWRGVRVSINVSAVQVLRPGFVDRLCAVLDEFGLDGSRFEIELTESCLLAEEARIMPVLMNLRRLGFQLSLDDFGTGFSSLGYLQKFPIDRIKLDRLFVAGLQEGSRSSAIVRAVVQLAAALQLELVAEGVETQEQLNMLVDLGVDEFQGFFFSKPVSCHALEAILDGRPGVEAFAHAAQAPCHAVEPALSR